MHPISLSLRLAAAAAALGASSSIVWAMSSYAYPAEPPFTPAELARMAHFGACTS
jgi:hypothetical protein